MCPNLAIPAWVCNAFRFIDLLDSTAAALSDYCQDSPKLQRSGGLSVRIQVVFLAIAGTFCGLPVRAVQPRIVEVPNGPAFVRLPGMSEVDAISGQVLSTDALLRTMKPGRMQVMLGTGRQFRMGGDAQLRLGHSGVELLKGAIIGWINPDTQNRAPFTIKTRLATASIQGTTVFIEYTDNYFKIFSWEGKVDVTTSSGQRFTLNSGQQLLLDSKLVGSSTDFPRCCAT